MRRDQLGAWKISFPSRPRRGLPLLRRAHHPARVQCLLGSHGAADVDASPPSDKVRTLPWVPEDDNLPTMLRIENQAVLRSSQSHCGAYGLAAISQIS